MNESIDDILARNRISRKRYWTYRKNGSNHLDALRLCRGRKPGAPEKVIPLTPAEINGLMRKWR